jgi:hypothetical protein
MTTPTLSAEQAIRIALRKTSWYDVLDMIRDEAEEAQQFHESTDYAEALQDLARALDHATGAAEAADYESPDSGVIV